MSYYNLHPVFGHRASSPVPSPYRLHSPTGLRHPSPRATEYDVDEEEQAAIAHLRRIQQRREAQQASIEREAAIRFQGEQERELAIRRAIAEKRRELAVAEALERQREKEVERARIHSAIQQHYLHQQAEQQHRQRRIVEQQRAAQHHAAQQLRQQQIAHAKERATRCAAKYAQRATQQAAKEVKKEYKDEYAALNNLLGSLFGISLEDEDAKDVQPNNTTPASASTPAQAAPAPTPAPAPATTSVSTEPFPSDINNLLSHFLGLRIEPASNANDPKPTAPAESAKPAQPNHVPAGLNEFLSNFGLVFEPTDSQQEAKPVEASPTPAAPAPVQQKADTTPVSVADPPEPTLPALPSSSSSCAEASTSSSARACSRPEVDDHPLTTFLNGMADMPPFVRDILGNVEMAFKEERDRSDQSQGQKAEEEIKGKGKAVAEGEKKASTPTPTPAAPVVPTTPVDTTTTALSTLSNISSELDLVRRSFDFPSRLSFATPSPDATSPPALLFNKTNSGYHAQAHKLLQLLLSADAITSDGNKDVRRKRKEVVRAVEEEIEGLEKKRDQVWEEVKAQREQGEIEVETASSSSCDSSVVDPSEIKEDIEHHEEAEEAKGFEVPVTKADATTTPAAEVDTDITTDNKTPAPEVNSTTDNTTPTESRVVDKSAKVEDAEDQAETMAKAEKDEGFELL